jgi:hypothetical protein
MNKYTKNGVIKKLDWNSKRDIDPSFFYFQITHNGWQLAAPKS